MPGAPSPLGSAEARAEFIRSHTVLEPVPMVAEIRIHTATELVPIWRATENWLVERGLGVPFWCVPWAGGQALARYVLEHPETVRGKRVLDFGAGSGLLAIAAAKAGAASVRAVDVDPLAIAACALNAAANEVVIDALCEDVVDGDPEADVVLAGDVWYELGASARFAKWLRAISERGIRVLTGDPGRHYVPSNARELAVYDVPTSMELESSRSRRSRVLELLPIPSSSGHDTPSRPADGRSHARASRSGRRGVCSPRLTMGFPTIRPRRLRATPELRALVRETTLNAGDFVYPMFFNAAIDAPRPIGSMPGIDQLPLSAARAQAKAIKERGVGSVILFGLPKTKDERGTSGLDPDGPVPRAIAEMKSAVPELVVMADVCVDEYTEHGHCGVLRKRADGSMEVDNDATVEILATMGVLFAKAGADVVAPSDMMDGRVAAMRAALDAEGFTSTTLLSYAVKYASSFYGPFREAADCAPKFGDRAGYQMDPANAREAIREAALDEAEGADMLMVKPALSYLDVIRDVRKASNLPLGAYNVSGEYSMLHAAADRGMIDRDRAILEVLTSIRRAGADFILTYHALRAAELLG